MFWSNTFVLLKENQCVRSKTFVLRKENNVLGPKKHKHASKYNCIGQTYWFYLRKNNFLAPRPALSPIHRPTRRRTNNNKRKTKKKQQQQVFGRAGPPKATYPGTKYAVRGVLSFTLIFHEVATGQGGFPVCEHEACHDQYGARSSCIPVWSSPVISRPSIWLSRSRL